MGSISAPMHIVAASSIWSVCLAFLQALEDCGIMQNIKRVAGSSAGAICAGLLAVGCSAQEIADVFKCDIKWLFHGMSVLPFTLDSSCASPTDEMHLSDWGQNRRNINLSVGRNVIRVNSHLIILLLWLLIHICLDLEGLIPQVNLPKSL